MKRYTPFHLLLFVLLVSWMHPTRAQQWVSSEGFVSFNIKSPVGGMQAMNDSLITSLDQRTGELTNEVWVKGFYFTTPRFSERMNAVMTYRFHEYYFQTDTYPDATFKGRIEGIDRLNLKGPVRDSLRLKGELILHGVPQKVNTLAYIQKEQAELEITFSMTIDPADFGVRIPVSLAEMYFNEVEITVTCLLKREE